jgi:tetratricopeptide (TPR) repeat protein
MRKTCLPILLSISSDPAFLLLLALVADGAAQQPKGVKNYSAVKVPPGVIPVVASRADSISRQLFAPLIQEDSSLVLLATAKEYQVKSDSLWDILERAAAGRFEVSAADSVAALKAAVQGVQKVQQATPAMQQYAKTQDQQARQQAVSYLQEAETFLRRAVALNPFSSQIKSNLAAVYKLLGDRFADKTNYDRAISIWETLVRLEPGEYLNYFYLGQNYFAGQIWDEALKNFERCETALLASAAVKDSRIADPSQPAMTAEDSTALFLAVYYQAESAIRLINEAKAYSSLRRAYALATTPQYRASVQARLTWMDWDNGNIVASMLHDSALVLARGQFTEAVKIYEKTLPVQRTSRAKNEIGWNLGVIEFSNLGAKNSAMERMLRIVQSIPTDSSGVPSNADTLNQVYFNTFGTMCVSLGNENIQIDRQLAYTYYMQGSTINWSGRAKAYFAMATLAEADPRQAVNDAEQAYRLVDQLDPDEAINLHKLLVRNYRRLGEFDKAKRHFEALVRLQGESSQSP